MAEGRGQFEWGMQSCLMALLHNLNVSKNKAVAPDVFNPYAKKTKQYAPLSVLKDVFVKK